MAEIALKVKPSSKPSVRKLSAEQYEVSITPKDIKRQEVERVLKSYFPSALNGKTFKSANGNILRYM